MDTGPISFGRFTLDLGLRELRRDGEPLQLPGRALDILCALATAKGEVVGKDDLMAGCGPAVSSKRAISMSMFRRYARRSMSTATATVTL